MSTTVIKVENLSKLYRIARRDPNTQRGYLTLCDTIRHRTQRAASSLTRIFRTTASPDPTVSAPPKYEDFWALSGISFDVQQGDRLALIGFNGAGKSTLLKILSRIVRPTSGRISLRGRISSLLEVGTGFHPELSGRENIYLNGAILGMTRSEIKRNFDAIVDFSGVDKFLDTPVKRYSSGMYVRLAFAVAAHLTSDILLIDEVLAVGDADFQKKCLNKMDAISHSEGRTIIFTTHDMSAISRLCNRAILLDRGRIALDTPDVPTAISQYNSHSP